MKIVKISCHSDCGSYFQPYLQSVTLIAESKEDAIERTKQWLKASQRVFIKREPLWEVEVLGDVAPGVIDYTVDTDY